MSENQNTKEIKAIPTEYKGIQLKSRLEAQCAFLFDKLGWDWEYEPKSYMLPNGVSYTPDFLIKDLCLFVECRGYKSKKGSLQISGFRDMISRGVDLGREYGLAIDFLVLNGDGEAACFRRESHTGMVMLLHCKGCGWRLAPFSSSTYDGMACFESFCESCMAPLSSPGWHKWDGRAIVDRAAIITVCQGKILVNGCGVEEFHG